MNLVVEIRKTNPSPQKPQDETKRMCTHGHIISKKTVKKIIEYRRVRSIVFFSCKLSKLHCLLQKYYD